MKPFSLAALAFVGSLGAAQAATAVDAHAAPQPKFVALGAAAEQAKPKSAAPAPAPVRYEMRGTLMADGTVTVDCDEVENPDARGFRHEHGDRQREAH